MGLKDNFKQAAKELIGTEMDKNGKTGGGQKP